MTGETGLTFSAMISGSGEESGDKGNVRARDDDEPSNHVDLTCRARARIEALCDCSSSYTLVSISKRKRRLTSEADPSELECS
jgi:hypothetical protein